MGRKRVDPGDDTVQIAVRLPARQVEELERRYEGRASSRSAAVRLAVAEVIAGGGPPLLGVHRDNPPDPAELAPVLGTAVAEARFVTSAPHGGTLPHSRAGRGERLVEEGNRAERERAAAAVGEPRFGRRVDPAAFRRIDPARKGKR
jgi:hypothetical protein